MNNTILIFPLIKHHCYPFHDGKLLHHLVVPHRCWDYCRASHLPWICHLPPMTIPVPSRIWLNTTFCRWWKGFGCVICTKRDFSCVLNCSWWIFISIKHYLLTPKKTIYQCISKGLKINLNLFLHLKLFLEQHQSDDTNSNP